MNFRSPSLALRLWTTLALIAASFALSGPASHAQAPQGLPKPLADFLEQHCLKCHDAETKKGSLDLSSLPSPSHNATSLGAWENVFDRVAEQEMPPPKKTQPKPGERQAFLNFLQGDLLAADRRRIASTGRVQSRRLTRSEFERSVQDVLGLYIPFQSHLPEDPLTDGFSTVAKGQQVSSNQLDTYLEVIDEALDAAFNQALTAREAWKTTLSWNELQRHNVPNVNVSRGPEGRPSQQDVVSWSTASRADFYGRMEATKVPENGWYKIRVRALAVNPPQGTRVSASLFAGKHISTAPERHLAGILEASATPEDFEFISWMHAKELLRLQVCDNTQRRPPAPRHPQNREMHEDLDGKGYVGVALQSLEMERVYPAWSPEDTRRALFGSLPVQPRPVSKNSAGKRKDSPASELDVVSENPARDLQSLVLLFANRAFRRPVQPNEIAGYVELAKAKLQSGASLAQALRTAYRGILMSPRFSYLEEAPGPLNAHALASRLSFFLWGAPPDAALRSLADSGRLLDPRILSSEVDRLLMHGNAKRFIRNFTDQWLKLREIDATNPDEKLYGEFDDALKNAMLEETQTFFWDLLKRDLSVKNLVASNHTFLNHRLAKHYGLPSPPLAGMQSVSLLPQHHRGGIITHASVLKVTANGTTTSPVVRGVWLLERIAGQHVPPPPPSVPAIEPDIRGAKTIRDQLDKHRSQESCALCHLKMDPPGFALENYDVIGGWRQNYRAVNEKGARIEGPKVDPSYHFPGGGGFEDLNDLKKSLLARPELLAKNLTRQLLTYATGASPSFADRESIDQIVSNCQSKDYGVRSLIHAAVQSPIFLRK